MSLMPTVQFRNVTKRYGGLTVIDNLDLEIADGEFVVLLGPSGCGKTTLLNILAGLLDIDAGAILIGGRDVTQLDPRDRGLAMVFQSYALYPTKTVRGNLAFGLSARKISSEEVTRRIDWAAKLLQISHLMDRRPAQLSGGQRQRVAIGRALVKQVGVCLFDEPLSNLDAKLRTEMRMEIKKLHGQLRNTIVYVTHDQVEAMTMATRIAVMDKGVIQQIGSPDDIYDRPETIFVADFVGSPSINLLDCEINATNSATMAIHDDSDVVFDLSHYAWREPVGAGRKVKVGFRAEHFRGAEDSTPTAAHLRFDRPVEFFEKSGPDAIAFLSLPRQVVAARVDVRVADAHRAGKDISLVLPLDKINVFDAQSGRRL
jgi:multiple sugar transport system ATP-binding protein